jgi:hypothetical protein
MGVVELVSINKDGTDSGAYGLDHLGIGPIVISADGRFVAFVSDAHDLVATDANGMKDVFVRDLKRRTTTLVSVNKDGTDSGAGSSGSRYSVGISADGRFVAFDSEADDLVAKDTNGTSDMFVRDLKNGTTTLVSVNKKGTDSGAGSSGDYNTGKISADGRFVVFDSKADDLVAKDTNGRSDLFVRDLQNSTTSLVSVNKDGTDSGIHSAIGILFVDISADGRYVVFNSESDDLVDTDTNGMWDVFVRDLQNGTTTLVSVNKAGKDSGRGTSHRPKISADGRFVAFTSSAADLVAMKYDIKRNDVFVRDLQSGTTTLVSINKDGTNSGNGSSYRPQISADGRFVAFVSTAGDLVATKDTNERSDVFLRDLQNGTTTLVSINNDGSDSGKGSSYRTQISADGRFVGFDSSADDLVATDTNGQLDVFVRDLQNETTTLVSVNKDGTDSAKGGSSDNKHVMSADGRFVVFESKANDLVATDTNRRKDVFVFEVFQSTSRFY